MGELSWWHILIIVAVFMLLFGARRLPDAARSLGQSLRIFKAETKGLREEDGNRSPSDGDQAARSEAPQLTPAQPPAQAPPVQHAPEAQPAKPAGESHDR